MQTPNAKILKMRTGRQMDGISIDTPYQGLIRTDRKQASIELDQVVVGEEHSLAAASHAHRLAVAQEY